MSEEMERPPWWLSGGDDNNDESNQSSEQGAWGGIPTDMWSLLGTVSSMAGEWWAASGARDHAQHGNPDDHPECTVCRVLVSVRTVTETPGAPEALPPAKWLPLRRV